MTGARRSPDTGAQGQRPPHPWLVPPLLLAGLALLDLRSEFQLLVQHFTFTALWFAVVSHPLSVAVLVLTPSLLRRGR